jgi:hypothetical protein
MALDDNDLILSGAFALIFELEDHITALQVIWHFQPTLPS